MAQILIQAGHGASAVDIQNGLAALWPDAQFTTDSEQATLVVSCNYSCITVTGQGIAQTMPVPVRLVRLAQMLREYAARPVTRIIGSARLETASRLWHPETGEPVALTEKEVGILLYLADQAPAAVSRDDLLRQVWKYAEGADTHTVETHLYRLRQKIEHSPDQPTIVVSTKQGYILGNTAE